MVKKEPELLDVSKKRRSDIYIEETNTSIMPLAFIAKKSDGFNPHVVVNCQRRFDFARKRQLNFVGFQRRRDVRN